MEEKVLCSIRAVVYIFDGETGGWAAGPVGDGLSRVEVLENEAERTYRVLGKGMDDAEVLCIDSPLIKETQFARASETFVQWNDPQAVYGINISSVEESDTICTCIDGILKKLNEEEASEGVVQEDAPKEQEVKETPEEPVKEVVKEEPTKEEPVKEVVKEEPAKEEPVKGAEPAKEEPKVVKKESVPVKGGASERPGGGTNRTGGAVLGPSIEGSLTRKVGAAIATHIQKMGPAGSKIKMQEVKACRDAIIEGIREELHKARQEIIQAIRAK